MDEEELMQGKFKAPTVQRQENTTGMPDSVKSKMESGLGSDFSAAAVARAQTVGFSTSTLLTIPTQLTK